MNRKMQKNRLRQLYCVIIIQLASNQYDNVNRDSFPNTQDVILQVSKNKNTGVDSYDVTEQNQRFEMANTRKTARHIVEREMTQSNLSSLLPNNF